MPLAVISARPAISLVRHRDIQVNIQATVIETRTVTVTGTATLRDAAAATPAAPGHAAVTCGHHAY